MPGAGNFRQISRESLQGSFRQPGESAGFNPLGRDAIASRGRDLTGRQYLPQPLHEGVIVSAPPTNQEFFYLGVIILHSAFYTGCSERAQGCLDICGCQIGARFSQYRLQPGHVEVFLACTFRGR